MITVSISAKITFLNGTSKRTNAYAASVQETSVPMILRTKISRVLPK